MCHNVFARFFLYRFFFPPATRFLHENGVLLHYNDQLRGLNHLYFIDPSWVCDLIATLVTIRERNPFIVDGVMKMKDLELVLRDPKFPEEFIPQVMFISRLKVRSICHLVPAPICPFTGVRGPGVPQNYNLGSCFFVTESDDY